LKGWVPDNDLGNDEHPARSRMIATPIQSSN
jgi:hypothetical protein